MKELGDWWTLENRSSKSTRISSPISIDSESDNSESDSNDLYGISELISSLKDLSSHSITTTEKKRASVALMTLITINYLFTVIKFVNCYVIISKLLYSEI